MRIASDLTDIEANQLDVLDYVNPTQSDTFQRTCIHLQTFILDWTMIDHFAVLGIRA